MAKHFDGVEAKMRDYVAKLDEQADDSFIQPAS